MKPENEDVRKAHELKALGLKALGLKPTNIGKMIGASRATVYRYLNMSADA